MRRRTVTTLAGIVVAVLLVATAPGAEATSGPQPGTFSLSIVGTANANVCCEDIVDMAAANVAGSPLPDIFVATDSSGYQPIVVDPASSSPRVIAVPTSRTMLDVAAGDFNGDGSADAAYATSGNADGPIQTWLNESAGGYWYKQQTLGVEANSSTVSDAVADLNGDGKLDIIHSWAQNTDPITQAGLRVNFGNGDGTFGPAMTYTIPDTTEGDPGYVAVGDINGDGHPDVVVSREHQLEVYLNDGTGHLEAPTITSYGDGLYLEGSRFTVADLNGDGRADVAITVNYGQLGVPGYLEVFLGNGDGTFQPPTLYSTGGEARAAAVGDFNGDGYPDIAVPNFFTTSCRCDSGNLVIFYGDGSGAFSAAPPIALGINFSNPRSIVVADFNGDGRDDIALGDRGGQIALLLAQGPDTTPPVITLARTTVDATSPAGAPLAAFGPSATDNRDPSPSLSCSPAVVPIGDQTISCSSTDNAGNTATASFSVHVRGAGEQLDDLGSEVDGIGPGKSLEAKVQTAETEFAAGDSSAPCSTLAALVNEVNAQTGKKLTVSQAAQIIADVDRIETVIGC